MNLLKLYKIAENEKINVINYNWNNTKARIFDIDNNYYIALDNKHIVDSIEEKEVLAEELGHYFCNALYYLNSDPILKNKCEYRAKKWAYSVLVPLHKLREKISEGINNIYELADCFNVDFEYMNNCINFYLTKGLIYETIYN